jgi:hypothetical protein
MSISLYDASIPGYLQMLGGMSRVLDKGAGQLGAAGRSVDAMLEARLHETMLPFSYQVHFVVHHSLGALRGMRAGLFAPPKDLPALDYAGLQRLVTDAAEELEGVQADEVNALAGKPLTFRLETGDIPFTMENFVLSFSLPNLHFHAAVAYALLRREGVELGKRDFLGNMRIGA